MADNGIEGARRMLEDGLSNPNGWAAGLPDQCVQCPLMEAGICEKFGEEAENGADPDALAAAVAAQLETRSLAIREATPEEQALILGGGNATG